MKVVVHKMPPTVYDLWDLIEDLSAHLSFVLLENVHSMPNDGKKAITTFMKHVGHLEMALAAAEISYGLIAPTKWQAHFGLLRKSKSETKTAKKNRHKAKAQALFNGHGFNIIHATADALLIAQYNLENNQAMYDHWIGIDPGIDGGIAIISRG